MLFNELIQVALGNKEKLSHPPSDNEWAELFSLAQKQAIVGVLFSTLDRLAKHGQKPPLQILFEWIALAEQIKQRNVLLNSRSEDLLRLFGNNGFQSCILKGQGNALMYPDPLTRTSGDIDIWVFGDREKIIEFCRSKRYACSLSYHHIQFPIWDDTEVEVHFFPSYALLPKYNKRVQQFFDEEKDKITTNGRLIVPSLMMNIVYQLIHMQHHFFSGGIGLRQVIDYYYLLICSYEKVDVNAIVSILRELGLYQFAGALMWILKEIFGMEEKFLFISIDKKRGGLLLDEIMKTGNFGHLDQRFSAKLKEKSTTLSNVIRNLRLLYLFPEEAVWAPIMDVWCYIKKQEK